MKRVIILAIAALVMAGAAAAQNGAICLFADPAGTSCSLTDDAPGLLNIYVVHSLAPGVMASQFFAPKPPCMVGATWVSDVTPFPVTIGDSQTGVAIGYATCQSTPLHILTIVYETSGTTLPDCAYYVRPHPNVDRIEAADCDNTIVYPGGGKIYINSDLDCLCAEDLPPQLSYWPMSLDFHENIQTLSVDISNLGGGELSWTAVEAMPWMNIQPQSGTNSGTIFVSADRRMVYPGEYSGPILIDSNGGTGEIPVDINVVAYLQVFPDHLDFELGELGYLSIHNAGDGIMRWSASADEPWITLVPESGEGDAGIEVAIDRTGLSGGTYTGHILVTSDGGNATIPVTILVGALLHVYPTELDFGYYSTYQEFDIENAGGGVLSWSIRSVPPWTVAVPISGTGDTTIAVTAFRTGLDNGHYEGTIEVESNGGSASVTALIDVGPSLFFAPTSLVFNGTTTEATFRIRNIGEGTLEWTLAPGADWITVYPEFGTGEATIAVTVDRCGLELGPIHNGSIAIHSNGGDGTVAIIAEGMPRLATSTNHLEFEQNNIEVRTFTVAMPCSGPLAWTATTASTWMTLDPVEGTGPGEVTVTVAWPYGVDNELWGVINVNEVGGPGSAAITVRYVPESPGVPTDKASWGSVKSKFRKTQDDGE